MINKKRYAIYALICVLVFTTIAYAVLTYKEEIGGTGKVKIDVVGIEVYGDSDLTTKVSSIDYGTLYPGGTSSKTLYIKSVSTVPITLTLGTGDWSPKITEEYMTFSWNYSNGVLYSDSVVVVELLLEVSPLISGVTDFSFTIIITAVEVV